MANIKGNKVILGNSKILSYFRIENSYKADEESLASKGNSIVYVVENKKIIGIIGVNDILRDNIKELVNKLKENKKEVIMLTGDNSLVAKNIANEVGIENVISNILPSDKANEIKKLKKQGKKVMMCGDRDK